MLKEIPVIVNGNPTHVVGKFIFNDEGKAILNACTKGLYYIDWCGVIAKSHTVRPAHPNKCAYTVLDEIEVKEISFNVVESSKKI